MGVPAIEAMLHAPTPALELTACECSGGCHAGLEYRTVVGHATDKLMHCGFILAHHSGLGSLTGQHTPVYFWQLHDLLTAICSAPIGGQRIACIVSFHAGQARLAGFNHLGQTWNLTAALCVSQGRDAALVVCAHAPP